ncbi:MAG: multinuclear nonheme iron-dependent oxidase [Terriglobales bacterium]
MSAGRLSVGTFYNPQVAEAILASGELIGHLSMADPPAADDAAFPRVREKFPLLLHDYLGQLADPMSDEALARAQRLQEMYQGPWVAEHFQCLHTQDGSRTLDYVFPPLYTEEFLQRFVSNARILREAVGAELVMENIPGFFSLEHAQMTESEFLRRFFEESGCGFLIDVPHLWLAAHYAGRDARQYIGEFPLEKVVEIHVGGVEDDPDLGGPWVAPQAPTEEILELAVWVRARTPKLRAVTVDMFAPSVTAELLLDSVRATRAAFGV